MGEIASAGIAINASTFAVKVLDSLGNLASSASINSCATVAVTNAPAAA
jgi:hypothetical protein